MCMPIGHITFHPQVCKVLILALRTFHLTGWKKCWLMVNHHCQPLAQSTQTVACDDVSKCKAGSGGDGVMLQAGPWPRSTAPLIVSTLPKLMDQHCQYKHIYLWSCLFPICHWIMWFLWSVPVRHWPNLQQWHLSCTCTFEVKAHWYWECSMP